MISKDHPKKLFLLDAYALIFRAYYAFIKNPRINSKGMNTSAIFGFTNALLDILKNEKPTHIAVVFDAPEKTFREEQFEAYKANRDETPADIKLSVPWIIKLIEGFNIPVLMKGGVEADDVIGTLAKRAEENGFVTYMMTPDKDFGQLVSDNVFMFKPGRGDSPPEVVGVPEICAKYGIDRPEQVIDILGMMGDAVDNIPGIPGIGEKTAMKLVSEFGSVEGLLANTDKLKGKQKETVEANVEQARMSRHLATIVTDVDIAFEPQKLIMEEPDRAVLEKLFEELEFRQISNRVFGTAAQAVPKVGIQMDLFGEPMAAPKGTRSPEAPSEEANAEAAPIRIRTLQDVPHDYILVNDETGLKALLKELETASEFCFDTETSDLDPLTSHLVGMSFATVPGKACYVPVPTQKAEAKRLLAHFAPIFSNPDKLLIAQNFKFDLKVLKMAGIEVKNQVFDTMIAHYLINPDGRHGMDYLAENYLKYRPVAIETLIGKKGKDQGSMADLTPAEILDYAAEDADITLQLKRHFESKMDEPHLKKLFFEVEIPLLAVLGDMELEGVNLDVPVLKLYSGALEKDLEVLEADIYREAGIKFNIDSPKQLGPVLFDHLGLGVKIKKTKTGQYSTGEEVLSELKNDHPIIPLILDYRELRKLKNTYVDPLPDMVNRVTGRIHTNFMQTVAATGRLSSNQPNLQNIPIRTERGREIRKAFIPRDENHLLVSADYSQVELRIIAALSEDSGMCEAFERDEDIHAATASKVFGVPLREVSREMRSKAKAVNFGIIYGQGAFGLAQNLGISRTEAKEIIDNYYRQFARLREYQMHNIESARKNGYVETVLGRRRYLPDINSGNAVVRGFAERNAINAPIQGSAADIIKLAMINLKRKMDEENLFSKMILQVHDELVFDTLKEEKNRIKALAQKEMESAFSMRVPLKAEVGEGENWLLAH